MNTFSQLKLSTCLLAASLLFPAAVFGQQDHSGGDHGSQHTMSQQGSGDGHGSGTGQGAGMNHGSGNGQGSGMNHGSGNGQGSGMSHESGMGQGDHHEQMMQRMQQRMGGQNSQAGGDSVFSQIQNKVRALQEDPDTDWSQVNLAALQQHLVDMEHLSLFAEVSTQYLSNGLRYTVTGEGRTLEAIQRMVPTHASQIAMELGMQVEAEATADGAWISVVTSDDNERAMYQAIGFLGLMTLGEHHEAHHQDMAGGSSGHAGH